MVIPKQVPVVEGLFAQTEDGPRLLGSRCCGCSTYYFPRSTVCRNPHCRQQRVEEVTLGGHGKLWSYTVQYYPPPPPFRFDEPFSPYAIGLIELPEGLRVLGMVSTHNVADLQVGMEMELVLEKLCHDENGDEVITWKFRPISESRTTG